MNSFLWPDTVRGWSQEPSQYSWPQKGLDYFFSPSGQLGENPRETVAKLFLLAVLRLAEQFYY